MKKILLRALVGILVILVVLVVAVALRGGTLIKSAVNTAGPAALGVPVTLKDATFLPLQGKVRLKGLHVGNPEGFKTDGLFDLGEVAVDLDTGSLLSDKIVINRILIKDPSITFERGLRDSNLGALMKGLEKEGGEPSGEAKEEKAEAAPAEGGKKVVIKDITIEGAKVNMSVTLAQGLAATLPLPTIQLKDVGEEKEGASLPEVLGEVLKAVFGAVTQVITGAGKLAVDGVQMAGEGALAVGKGAVKGAEVVGGAAVDGAQAIGSGAAKVVGGIGNLLGGGDGEKKVSSDQ